MSKLTSHPATEPIDDNLAVFSSVDELKETRNILRYRFAFDFGDAYNNRKQSVQEDTEVLQRIFDLPVFSADNTFRIPVELFGTSDFYYRHDDKITEAIHSHCAISALHTVKYLLWREGSDDENQKVVKGNTAAKYVSEHLEEGTPGYYYLNSIEYDDSRLNILSFDYPSYESKVSNFFRHMKEEDIKPDMKFAYSLLGKYSYRERDNKKTNAGDLEIPVYNMDLYHHIISNKDFFMNKTHIRNNMNREPFVSYMNSYGRIASSAAFNSSAEAKVDNLLLRYQLERYFNASLYEYLFKKHKSHHENSENNIILSGDNYFAIIQKFSLLPNVFSRHIFADWAYEMISSKNSEKVFVNYFDSPNEMKFGLIHNEEKFNPRLKTPNTEYSTWCYVLESALEYLSTVTFPMYEKTFFIGLYEFFASNISAPSPYSVLKKMEKILYSYCEDLSDMDVWESQLSFLNWDCQDSEQYKEEKIFYLEVINKMLSKNNLQSLYKMTFDRKYFGTQGDAFHARETASINYYQRQLMFLKNKSDSRETSL